MEVDETKDFCTACKRAEASNDNHMNCPSCGDRFCSTCMSKPTKSNSGCIECLTTLQLTSHETTDISHSPFRKRSSSSTNSKEESSSVEDVRTDDQNTLYVLSHQGQNIVNNFVATTPLNPSITEQSNRLEHDKSDGERVEKGLDEPLMASEESTANNPRDNEIPAVVIQEFETNLLVDSRESNVSPPLQHRDSLSIESNNHLLPPDAIQVTHVEYETLIANQSLNSSVNIDSGKTRSNTHGNYNQYQNLDSSELTPVTEPASYLPKHILSEKIRYEVNVDNDSSVDSIFPNCSNSLDFDHGLMTPDLHTQVADVELSLNKKLELQRFDDQIQILHEVVETLDDAILTMKVEQEQQSILKQNLLKQINDIEDQIELTKHEVEEAVKNKSSVERTTEILRATKEEVKKSESLDCLRATLEQSSETMSQAEDIGTQVEIQYMHFLLCKNVHKPEYVERMIDLGVQIFAEHQVEGEQRWAKVSLLDAKIHVHSLQPLPPPSQSYILPWSCLMGMTSPEKMLTFMDISVSGTSQGRVYFSMFGNTPRAQQFVILSSGEHKYSYRNVKMKQLGNSDEPGEYVSFNGPKTLKGPPIRGVVSGITQGGVHTRRKTKGLLAGAALSHRQRTLFAVYLNSDPDEDTTGSFGEVAQGLEILKEVSRHEPPSDVEIEDCGIVIYLIQVIHK